MAKKVSVFGLIFALVIVLYLPVFNIYFTGDDFFHFKVSLTDGSLVSFIKLFGFYSFDSRGIAFYRPLFREALYNIFYRIWGLNAFPFRVLAMLMHFTNIVLVFVYIKKLLKSEGSAYLTSFLFAISTANIGAIYYLAGGLQTQGALLFTLCALILFNKHRMLAFITFLLALMSHEIAIVIPVLIAGQMLLEKNFKLKHLWPYIVVSGFYLFVELKIIGFSRSEEQYKLNFNPKSSLNGLFWYGLWSYGLPETLVDLVNPGFKLNPDLWKNWGDLYRVIFPAFFTSVGFLIISIVSTIKARRLAISKLKIKWELLFLLGFFVAGLSTVLFLPSHRSTYYLAISLPAFCALLAYFLFKGGLINKIFSALFLVSFLILTIYTTKNMDITFWAAQRGRLSQRLVRDFKNMYPTIPGNSVVLIKNDPNYPFISESWGGTSKQASLILSGSDALQLLYNDPSLKVYYEDFGGLPTNLQSKNTLEFIAKIN